MLAYPQFIFVLGAKFMRIGEVCSMEITLMDGLAFLSRNGARLLGREGMAWSDAVWFLYDNNLGSIEFGI